MNPFKAVGKVITFPVHEAKNAVRLVQTERAADALEDALEDGADHPELYRQPSYWDRVLTAAAALCRVLPLPEQGRVEMTNVILKIGTLASVTASIAAALHGAGLPAGADHYVAIIGSVAATIFAYLHPSPAQTAQ